MYDVYSELEELCETTSKELKDANNKIRNNGGKLSPSDLEYVDKLTHMLKSIKTTMAMMDAEDGYSSMGNYNHTGSYARRRDSMGRYSSRGRSYDDGFKAELHELMNDAPDERTKQKLQRIISEMG